MGFVTFGLEANKLNFCENRCKYNCSCQILAKVPPRRKQCYSPQHIKYGINVILPNVVKSGLVVQIFKFFAKGTSAKIEWIL